MSFLPEFSARMLWYYAAFQSNILQSVPDVVSIIVVAWWQRCKLHSQTMQPLHRARRYYVLELVIQRSVRRLSCHSWRKLQSISATVVRRPDQSPIVLIGAHVWHISSLYTNSTVHSQTQWRNQGDTGPSGNPWRKTCTANSATSWSFGKTLSLHDMRCLPLHRVPVHCIMSFSNDSACCRSTCP